MVTAGSTLITILFILSGIVFKEYEENYQSFLEFKIYKSFFKKIDIIVDHNERKKLIEKGNEAIDGILSLAKESEHPRTYEVAGQLIQTVSQVSQDLLGLQSRLKRLKEVPNNAPKNVTNALYVGSTNELQKLLKKTKKDDGESES